MYSDEQITDDANGAVKLACLSFLQEHKAFSDIEDIKTEEELIGLKNFIEKQIISDQHKKATYIFFKINKSHFTQIIKN